MPAAPINWVPVENTTAEVIPGGGLMAVTSVVDVGGVGVYRVGKPTADGQLCLVNDFMGIPPKNLTSATAPGRGTGTFDPRVVIAYDPADGTPALGDTYGAATGNWLARKNRGGFLIQGGAGGGFANAVRAAGGLGNPESFLAYLYAKCYYDGSDTRAGDGVTPTGSGINCPPDLACLSRFRAYSWSRVLESEPTDANGLPCPLSYAELSPRQEGSPQCFPAIHVNDIDYPVGWPASPRTNYAGAAADNAGAGSVAWTNPANATGPNDANYATATLANGQSTHYLVLSGFCFGLPGRVTVTNIEVDVGALASAAGVQDVEVKLFVGGSITGNNKATNTNLPTTYGVRTYSFSPASWSVTVAPVRIVNAANFGVAIRYTNTDSAQHTVSVGDVQIKLTFTPAGSAIPKQAVVRLWRGAGPFYLFHQLPPEDLLFRSGSSDGDGVISWIRNWDQNVPQWQSEEECRVVVSG
jgi:hypothetical protein